MEKPQFVYVTYIATTPEKLWHALTSAEFTRRYWAGRRIESEWRKGAPVRWFTHDGTPDTEGEVLEVTPPRRLSYTFKPLENPNRRDIQDKPATNLGSDEPPSRVTFEIEPERGAMKLTVIHDQFQPDSEVLKRVSRGWPAILSALKSLLERDSELFPDWK